MLKNTRACVAKTSFHPVIKIRGIPVFATGDPCHLSGWKRFVHEKEKTAAPSYKPDTGKSQHSRVSWLTRWICLGRHSETKVMLQRWPHALIVREARTNENQLADLLSTTTILKPLYYDWQPNTLRWNAVKIMATYHPWPIYPTHRCMLDIAACSNLKLLNTWLNTTIQQHFPCG